jgi:Asp-tRNA(Asn)/Glu-tRNA(Gln) amidotransferase C subunit
MKNNFGDNLETTTYNEVHNIIYGALAYAKDLGFKPHKDFAVAQYILEADSDAIPLIEYEFGRNGKPMLIVNTRAEFNRYTAVLKRAVGDEFTFLVREELDDDDDFDDETDYEDDCDCIDCQARRLAKMMLDNTSEEDKEKLLAELKKIESEIEKIESLPHTIYDYQYPDYPQKLELTHKELEALFDPQNNDELDEETFHTILSLPRETLIKDLEHCLLYEIGQNCYEISQKNEEEGFYGSIANILALMKELNATESLPVALEVMRQNYDFYDFFFADEATEFLSSVIYPLSKNQLTVLLDYFKEPNLNIYFKSVVSTVFTMVLDEEPERRAEIIHLYDNILDFLFENINDTAYYDAALAGLLINKLIDIKAKELLPKIKRLFDTGLVDEIVCGNYEQVEKEIKSSKILNKINSFFNKLLP